MRKLFAAALTAGVVLSGASMTHAEETAPVKDIGSIHAGETPIESFVTKEGIRIDVYNVLEPLPNPGVQLLLNDGAWGRVGTDTWTVDGTGATKNDAIFKSTGGDYMVRVPGHSATSYPNGVAGDYIDVSLWEDDGATGDDHVTDFAVVESSSTRDYITRNLNGYTDGIPLEAEFYTTHKAWYKASNLTVNYYD